MMKEEHNTIMLPVVPCFPPNTACALEKNIKKRNYDSSRPLQTPNYGDILVSNWILHIRLPLPRKIAQNSHSRSDARSELLGTAPNNTYPRYDHHVTHNLYFVNIYVCVAS